MQSTTVEEKEDLIALDKVRKEVEVKAAYEALGTSRPEVLHYLTEAEIEKLELFPDDLPTPPEPIDTATYLNFDDSIQSYLWVMKMPNCFEKTLKRIRCLLCIYLKIIQKAYTQSEFEPIWSAVSSFL
jgi:hypothetical protein